MKTSNPQSWQEQNTHQRLKTLCCFLSAYATAMLSAGATTSRIERCVNRIASRYGVGIDLSILPTRVLMSVWDVNHHHYYSIVGQTQSDGINLAVSTELSLLSHEIEEWRPTEEVPEPVMPIALATAKMNGIIDTPRINHWAVIVLTSVANLSFCKLFGGDLSAMAIVFVATAVGFFYKEKMLSWHIDGKLVVLLSAMISAILGASGLIFGISTTPETALGTSVLWLVPGIRFINAVSDMLRGQYLVAQSRMSEALIITICLSMGLCLALLITKIQWV